MMDFYSTLNTCYELVRSATAQIEQGLASIDLVKNTITNLMEQASHLQSTLENVPLHPPVAPPYVRAGELGNFVPAIPLPASSLIEATDSSNPWLPPVPEPAVELDANPIPEPIIEPSFAGVRYDTPQPSANIGVIKYE